MVELPPGNIIEERRGGAGILATLLNEMIKLGTNGYLRTERTPNQKMPRVGQVIVFNGEIAAAIHQCDAILDSVDALIEIESDCQELDCLIQLIEGVDVQQILDLHPAAHLNVETPEKDKSSEWWQNISNRTNAWTRASKLPTIDATVEAPEFVKAKAASLVHRAIRPGILLRPGCVYSSSSNQLFELASNLEKNGKPLLVISRKTREEISVNFDIPAKKCLWLSQNEGEGIQFVDIDAIKGTVYGFLEGNLRAVLLLDGLEYLASICGEKAVIELVRELGDRMRSEDDCLLISIDESAWKSSDSAQIIRAAPNLDTETIISWNQDPEVLLDHPLFSPPTEEELLRLNSYLERNMPETFRMEEVVETNTEAEPELTEEIIIEEVEEIISQVPEEAEEEILEKVEEEEELVEIVKGPRKAQVVRRRKSVSPKVMNDRETRLSGLAAVNKTKIVAEFPATKPIPKTVIGDGKDGRFELIPETITTSLGQAAKQDSAKINHILPKTKVAPKSIQKKVSSKQKKVISPLAARGVEVKRNISNRRQASSVPQREIDIDKELDSWTKEEDESQ